jgi:hypothetical protein
MDLERLIEYARAAATDALVVELVTRAIDVSDGSATDALPGTSIVERIGELNDGDDPEAAAGVILVMTSWIAACIISLAADTERSPLEVLQELALEMTATDAPPE